MTLTVLPDFETLVIERLKVNLGEITGIQYVLENPPVGPVGVSDVPFAYPLVGSMVNSTPAQSTGAGRVVVTRNYLIIIEANKGESDTDGARGEGSKGYKALRQLIAPVRNYFITHASLETNAGGGVNKLQGIQEQISIRDEGIQNQDGRYALRFTLTVSMGASLTPTKRLA